METGRFRDGDAVEFLRLADSEGWICDEWEPGFLCRAFPQGCLVKRVRGFPVAYVTSIRHDTSGWIGNLLVHQDLRRRGLGADLMAQAVTALEAAGVATIWLTASPSGKPLYERLGFLEIDRVQRWFGYDCRIIPPSDRQPAPELMKEMDAAGWGDRRDLLVDALATEGCPIGGPDAFMVTRSVGPLRQIGPWGGDCATAQALFEESVRPFPDGEKICLDVPSGNEAIGRFLEQSSFRVSGSTVLMFRGTPPAYRPELICALASMGSMG